MPSATQPTSPNGMLSDEIRMIRSVMLRVMELAEDSPDLGEMLKLLNTVSIASTRLAALLKTDRLLAKSDDLTTLLNDALAEMLEELNQPPVRE